MNRYIQITLTQLIKIIGYGTIGAFIALITAAVLYLDSRPDLKVWHTADLDAEFTVDSNVDNFSSYLNLEAKLFAQLQSAVIQKIQPTDKHRINRYTPGSMSDPLQWPQNWNRSFVLTADTPRIGVLLLHGMSDSPYSLRNLGQTLHGKGASVIGLRLPGHGTAPSGLTTAHWEDMSAAVQLAMQQLRDISGDKPLFILGYSTGGGLAIHYVINTIEDKSLPAVQGVAMLSPAIGVSAFAALAVWQARIGHVLGLEKLEWNSLLPEYDPFKYGSFAVNAGDQVYRLTQAISAGLTRLEETDRLRDIPPILAFQSIVDATVSTPALVDRLFRRLPDSAHELVLFDVNRDSTTSELLAVNPEQAIKQLLQDNTLNFTVSVVSNAGPDTGQIAISRKPPQRMAIKTELLPLHWPKNIYSLSHVALPFAADDPLYGGNSAKQGARIHLGDLSLKGEKGVLRVPAADMLRQRWNPFYPYVEQRILDFVGL